VIETKAAKDSRMQWWREARFGLFIHWGLYAIPEGEWNGQKWYAEWIRRQAKIPAKTYDAFVDQFNPESFDADAWVSAAKAAGMKYIVITSKHHDGFCLWPSAYTRYDVDSTPFKRDILGELAAACKAQGIQFCLYYSIMDWHHPHYPPHRWEQDRSEYFVDMDAYTADMKGQLRELLDRYDPAVLWFDGEWEAPWTHDRGKDLYDYLRILKPNLIINNRVDKGRRPPKVASSGLTKEGEFRGDFGTPEQEIPHTGVPGIDWESCMTMNQHWGWNKTDNNWKSGTVLIRQLIDIASKGGNYLLNIGPKPDGTFPKQSLDRLSILGQWLTVNGEAIYGSVASPHGLPEWGRFTQGTGKLYAHVFDWPNDGQLELAIGDLKVSKIYFLNDAKQKRLKSKVRSGKRIVEIPTEAPDAYASVLVIEHR
jgi:alpha-L-fucosidase